MSLGPRPSPKDVIAGVGVALILIPQSMAYAELAGLPARHGLFAAALGPLAAAFFASSPYLQTGPVALTALLTLGALVPVAVPGSAEYVGFAALLALVVGIVRVLVGALRGGWVSYLMSRPMLDGFASGAAILIVCSQLPGAFSVDASGDGVLSRALWAIRHPSDWEQGSSLLAMLTLLIVIGARRLNPLVPGVLIATVVGLSFSLATDYGGPRLGDVDAGLPDLSLALPWASLPALVLPGIVIALVGFAEAASISRIYATKERMRWNPDQEFIGQGAANIAAGLFGGFPVGGSFSRSSLNYLRRWWAGSPFGLRSYSPRMSSRPWSWASSRRSPSIFGASLSRVSNSGSREPLCTSSRAVSSGSARRPSSRRPSRGGWPLLRRRNDWCSISTASVESTSRAPRCSGSSWTSFERGGSMWR